MKSTYNQRSTYNVFFRQRKESWNWKMPGHKADWQRNRRKQNMDFNFSCAIFYLYSNWFLCKIENVSKHIIYPRLTVGQSLDNVWFFSCLKSKHFFLFNYVPHLFLLTCVKFHGKKIDNNNALTHICLLPFFQMASYYVT